MTKRDLVMTLGIIAAMTVPAARSLAAGSGDHHSQQRQSATLTTLSTLASMVTATPCSQDEDNGGNDHQDGKRQGSKDRGNGDHENACVCVSGDQGDQGDHHGDKHDDGNTEHKGHKVCPTPTSTPIGTATSTTTPTTTGTPATSTAATGTATVGTTTTGTMTPAATGTPVTGPPVTGTPATGTPPATGTTTPATTGTPATGTPQTTSTPQGTAVSHYQHVFVIVLENHEYNRIIGNPLAPHINNYALTYGQATNYYGVTHPSEPNYVATIGGNYFGIQDDAPFSSTTNGVIHTIDAPSLASQLDAAGLTWKDYQQSLPYPGYLGTTYPSATEPLYASKHNPFLNFKSVQDSQTELHKIVPDTAITPDLSSVATTPNFSYIAPDQCHDMHGTSSCPTDATLIPDGDNYTYNTVQRIMGSPVWSTGNTAIVITFDEGDTNLGCCDAPPAQTPVPGGVSATGGGGHVVTIVITNHGPHSVQDPALYNHYALLRTIQNAFGLGCLQYTCDTANVKTMGPLFATTGMTTATANRTSNAATLAYSARAATMSFLAAH